MNKTTYVFGPLLLVAGCIAGTLFAAETLAPVKIELPQPFFGGTPLDYWSSNLEPKSTEPRMRTLPSKRSPMVVGRGPPSGKTSG